MKHLQYWTSMALLSGAVGLLWSRGRVDRVPASLPLDSLPLHFGSWSGEDVPLEGYVLDVLGKGVFLNRNYVPERSQAGAPATGNLSNANLAVMEQPEQLDPMARPGPAGQAPIGLFIGYFPTQRTGQAIHSPQNCLPGAGWVFNGSSITELRDNSGRQYRVGDYLISNGKQQDEVFYWYQEHGRSIASDYTAKWYTLVDSIRYHRTDAALIRIITPVMPGESRSQTQQRLVSFGNRLVSALPAYVPD